MHVAISNNADSTLKCLQGRANGKFVNLLLRLGYLTVFDLASEAEANISALPGCGRKTLVLLREMLAARGLSFAEPAQLNLMPAILSANGARLRLVKN